MSSSNSFTKIIVDHVKKDYGHEDNIEGWRRLPEIPCGEEILAPSGRSQNESYSDDEDLEDSNNDFGLTLPSNVVDKAWRNKGEYISAHYKLLREDAIAPLRQAVAEYRSQPAMKDNQEVAVYTHVYIVGMTFSSLGPALRIEFSYEKAGKRIRWKQSKRLQQGTIVALTPAHDRFRTICKVAVVAARPLQGVEQNPPQIDIFWGDVRDADFNPIEEYTMIEAKSGYFEASRHMLVAMQKLITERFPLSDHLVYLKKSIGAPEFIERQPLADLNSLKPENKDGDIHFRMGLIPIDEDDSLNSVNVLGQWPKISGAKLDESQMNALRRFFNKKLAVVQGPPGTGKTFTSITGLSVMLENLHPGDPPIVVAAQTNHALDQLLNLIAPVEPNFLRLGGRTSEDNVVVKERTLYEVRNRTPAGSGFARFSLKNARNSLDSTSLKLQTDIENAIMQGDGEAKALLKLELISKDQFDSLHDDGWISAQDFGLPPGVMALWLGREQLTDAPKCSPISIGFGEEESPEFEALEEAEMETGRKDADDMDALNGKWYPFKELYTGVASPGYSDKKLKKILDSTRNLWEIAPTIRGEVYRYLRRRLKAKLLESFREHFKEYQGDVESVKIARWQGDAALIQKTRIKLIGCTTTGLSKYRGLLASLQPRTLLIEEAAETLEGTILAAMFDDLQQLILIGDHQQLQAHCNISALEKAPYNLSVSMFERLVNNGIEYTMLNKQRRMIPEIRELLDPFYPNLQDHSSVLDRVKNRQPVPGMGGRDSYFFHHQWPESRDDFLSRFNVYEAEMVAHFFAYLVLNGVEPSQITVLTFYNGQKKMIQRELRRQPELAQNAFKFNVFTVDSYQGEENDIILLSLVRSNDNHSIGFLENKNRAVVSLSRARRGMYIFGNSINLLAANTQSFKLWSAITDRLRNRKRLDISSGLPVVCQNHHTETMILEPSDWVHLTGGCDRKCNAELPCGHSCTYNCHPFSHDDIYCSAPCRNILFCGHECTQKCGDVCRCECETIASQAQSVTSKGQDELWQRSLDDILGDMSTKSGLASQKTLSGQSSTPITSSSSSTHSSPRKWREWNANKADEDLRGLQAIITHNSNSITETNLPVLRDTYRPVAIENGSRVRLLNGTAANGLQGMSLAATHHPRVLNQQSNSAQTPKIPRNDKESAVVGKGLQQGINFKLLSSRITNATSSEHEKRAPPPPEIVLAGFSFTETPKYPPVITVSTPLISLREFTAFNDIGCLAIEAEEDLISFG